jgi:hypothetical protein
VHNTARAIAEDLPGFVEVATMMLAGGKITIDVIPSDLCEQLEAVYVWCTPAGEWLRVGTSCSRPLKSRLSDYPKHLNRALAGEEIKHTPKEYAEKWRDALIGHGKLVAKAYLPARVETPAGPLRPTLDIERVLIKKHGRPPLNRGHH